MKPVKAVLGVNVTGCQINLEVGFALRLLGTVNSRGAECGVVSGAGKWLSRQRRGRLAALAGRDVGAVSLQ